MNSLILEEKDTSNSEDSNLRVKYGELVLLGYNGCLPKGNRGRKRSKFELYKRQNPNGVKKSKHYELRSTNLLQAILDIKQHSISYNLSEDKAIVVEYRDDQSTDMFQIGRSSEAAIDFVVMDVIPTIGNKKLTQSRVSRFACRILVDRTTKIARIYAAGFDTSRSIILGKKSFKWLENDSEIDGYTTNKTLIMHPKGSFYGGEGNCDCWLGVSIEGRVYSLQGARTMQQKGQLIEGSTNVLQDGTLIDLGCATLLWRSAEGLLKSPTRKCLEREIELMNATSPRKVLPNKNQQQLLYVSLNCGHILEMPDWNQDKYIEDYNCPFCSKVGPVVKACIGSEPAFYVDVGPMTYIFNPCGHMTTEKTVKYWARMPVPCGTNDFCSICPFCALPLTSSPGYVKLI